MKRARAIRAGCFLIISAVPLVAARAGDSASASIEFFESKVRPILIERCQGCHGPEKQKAGLRLDSRQGMMRGGESGPILAPGKPSESRLIEVVRYDSDVQMPPKNKLSDPEIAALTEWVRRGAHWPADPAGSPAASTPTAPALAAPTPIRAEDRAFWSFQPVRRPPIPAVSDPAWAARPIDAFVLQALEARHLRPVAPAAKRTLIRRASFDLIGLPPTPDEVEAFLRDDAPDAFARVVERLLASPHYGERWGRYWLDLARYGEDQAHSFQPRLYPNGWRYRDYVARAFNTDKPYNTFVIEQIAGDLIDSPNREDRLAATGLFATGPVYYGKAVFDELNDRVDVLTRAFLGLTVACARCHDHKYDPIPQNDYYALAGIFTSTDYKEYPAGPPEAVAHFEAGQTAIADKTRAIDDRIKAETTRLIEQTAATETARYVLAAWTLTNRRKADPGTTTAAVAKAEQCEPRILDRWLELLNADPPLFDSWKKLANDKSEGESARAAASAVAEAIQGDVQATLELRDLIERRREATTASRGTDAARAATQLGAADRALLDRVASPSGPFRIPREEAEKRLPKPIQDEIRALRVALEKLKKDAPAKFPVIHALADSSRPANMRVHLRGNDETLGEEVPRHFLSVLAASSDAGFTSGSGRLALAHAIADPENPLTARVLVNRIWEHHFGRGLVDTPSNFGKLGSRPTHPELLDWLASEFIAKGWSIKALHREIMLSATYQLASDFDSADNEIDAENRWLWRANRRRLEVEAWRDAALAVTGELNPALGGPSLELSDPKDRRRTFYAAISRHNLDGLLRLFDFPDPNLTSDKRPETAAPTQQLFVLNSPFMLERAEALARRLAAEPNHDLDARVDQAYSWLYGRTATAAEHKLARDFLESGDEATRPARRRHYTHALLAANEFLYID